jgi:hypothetical protein
VCYEDLLVNYLGDLNYERIRVQLSQPSSRRDDIDLVQIDSCESREVPIIKEETQNSTVAKVVAIDVSPFSDALTSKAENPKSLGVDRRT